jgi:hypothetical protein
MFKKILSIFVLFFSVKSFCQPISKQYLGAPNTQIYIRGWASADSGLLNAIKDTILAPVRVGEQRFRSADGLVYLAKSTTADHKWFTDGLPSVITDYQKSATLTDGAIYKAWPSAVNTPNRDTVFMVYKTAPSHGEDGYLMGAYSINGGSSWVVDTITINGVNEQGGTVDIGYYSGRLLIDYTETADATVYDTTRFAYCASSSFPYFTKGSMVAKTTSQGNVSPYGRMKVMPSGTLLFPAYSWNTGTDSATAFLYQSINGGLTWSIGPTIAKKKRSGSFPDGDFNETNIEIISPGLTDATTTMIAISRSESYPGYHYLFYTTGGFTTWVDASVTQGDWAFGSLNSSAAWAFPPAALYNDGINLYAFVGYRGASQKFYMKIFKKPLSAYKTASAASWTKINGQSYTTLFQALNSTKGGTVDFGYPTSFLTPTNELKIDFYDVAVSARPGVDGINNPTIENVVPVFGNNFFESYATSNQSITTGTETSVSVPNIWFDSEDSYSTDSSKIYIQQDGWYQFYAKVMFDTSSLGTYRQAKLYAVDWGASYGTTPQYAKYTIAKQTIKPSTNSDFCYIELSGQLYCYKNMEIRLAVKHDKGSSLNILSTNTLYPTLENNATIRFKKIN